MKLILAEAFNFDQDQLHKDAKEAPVIELPRQGLQTRHDRFTARLNHITGFYSTPKDSDEVSFELEKVLNDSDSPIYTKGPNYVTPRFAMQALGDGMRWIYPDVWVDWLMRRLDKLEETNPKTVAIVTDVRFPNEADAIRERGGLLINITRDAADTTDTHISENALEDYPFDIGILNNYPLDVIEPMLFELLDLSLGIEDAGTLN